MNDYLTLNDLAERWDTTNGALRTRMYRGQLPKPDRTFGKSPVWLPETIEEYERATNGRDDTD